MLVLKAINFATKKHIGQVRKVSQEPYITHPLKVSYLLASFKQQSKNMDELLCAALLHDTLEDTNTTFEEISTEFSPLVASIVEELTSDTDDITKVGKKQYLMKKMQGMSSYALTIKLVDRLANLMDNPTEKTKQDTREIIDYLITNRDMSKTQMKIIYNIMKLI